MKHTICSLAAMGALALPACHDSLDEQRFAPVARVEFEPIAEMSGIIRQYGSDIYWVHNDSGDQPRIFAIDLDGNTVVPDALRDRFYGDQPEPGKSPWPGIHIEGAENVDWEDMASDGLHLYLADVGNNFNNRRDLGIYQVRWTEIGEKESAAVNRHIPVSYPEQDSFPSANRHFDSESLFFANGSLYLITKHRMPLPSNAMAPGANLYRLDTMDEDQDNSLTLIDHHPGVTAATAADLSPNNSRLAVLTYSALWVFERPEIADLWLSSSARRLDFPEDSVGQVEAVVWEDSDTLIFTNEQRNIYRVTLDQFQLVN
ncbi:MAG: hypothetical protein RL120_12260 [Gammaproteobacteria bacterium]